MSSSLPHPDPPLNASRLRNARFGWKFVLSFCVIFVLAVLPYLHRLEFFDGVEHFTLATVQEMKRDGGNWLLPTLEGEPRVVKPPMTAWITAALVPPTTVQALSDRDPAARTAAFNRFVFFARLPTLLCTVLMLLGVCRLGRAVAGASTGTIATMVCASFLLFLFQSRRATTDLQLACWVTWTNALLATAIFQHRPRLGLIGAGVALGLASMAKGPHIALLMTVAPVIVFLFLKRLLSAKAQADGLANEAARTLAPSRKKSELFIPILLGALLALVIGLWWYVYVYFKVPGVIDIWRREVFRKDVNIGRNILKPDPWYAYNAIFSLLLPWTAWVIVGAWHAIKAKDEGGRMKDEKGKAPSPFSSFIPHPSSLRLPLLMLLLPIVVMSFFSEKKTRYLLPFVGPAAVLAAVAISRFIDDEQLKPPGHKRLSIGRVAVVITTVAAAWFAVGLPIAGAIGFNKSFRNFTGDPLFTPTYAAVMAGVGLIGLIASVLWSRRSIFLWMVAIVFVGWVGAEVRLNGDTLTQGDADDRPQRDLAALIWQQYPDATIYSADPATLYGQLNRAAIVLSIHTNRIVYAKPDDLPTHRADKPLVLLTDSVQTVPPVPPGWKRLTELPLRTGKRYVDVLE